MDPAGRFATSYDQDSALVRTRAQAVTLVLFLILLMLGPLFLNAKLMSYVTLVCITTIAVVGLQITTGMAGQVNLGQASMIGVGGYATAFLSTTYSLPFYVVMPIAGLAAAAYGALFGVSAARVKGFYLALTTIAAQMIFPFVILNLPSSWLGGPNGLRVIPAEIFGHRMISDTSLYLLCVTTCIVMVYGAFGLARSRYGRAFEAVRDDELAAGMTGLNVVWLKTLSFLIGAFFAGIAGSLTAYQLRFVSYDQFTLFSSIWLLAMVVIGGIGSITGAIVGAVLVIGLQDLVTMSAPTMLSLAPSLGSSFVFASINVLLGAAIAVVLIFEPRGLMYRWSALKAMYRRWPFAAR